MEKSPHNLRVEKYYLGAIQRACQILLLLAASSFWIQSFIQLVGRGSFKILIGYQHAYMALPRPSKLNWIALQQPRQLHDNMHPSNHTPPKSLQRHYTLHHRSTKLPKTLLPIFIKWLILIIFIIYSKKIMHY